MTGRPDHVEDACVTQSAKLTQKSPVKSEKWSLVLGEHWGGFMSVTRS